jgi:hypothetical protein
MRTRPLGKALVGLAIAASTIGLLGLPASAHTGSGTGEVTAGTLELLGTNSPPPIHTQDLSLTTTECSPSDTTLFMDDLLTNPHAPTTTGEWTATLFSDTVVTIGTPTFRAVLNATLSGTYSGSTLTGVTGTATVALRKSTGCTYLTTAGTCTIAVTNLLVTGTHTVTPTPDIAVNDTATVSGGTPSGAGSLTFEVAVTGTATDCGSLIGADDGAVTVTNVTVLVTSVP